MSSLIRLARGGFLLRDRKVARFPCGDSLRQREYPFGERRDCGILKLGGGKGSGWSSFPRVKNTWAPSPSRRGAKIFATVSVMSPSVTGGSP